MAPSQLNDQTADTLPVWLSAAVVLVAAALLFFNAPLVNDLRLSHLAILVMAACAAFRLRAIKRLPMSLVIALALPVVATALHLALGIVTIRQIIPDAAKLGLLLLATAAFLTWPKKRLTRGITLFAFVAAIAVIYNYIFGNWAYYDYVRLRFGIEMIGSPNTTAYALAFCVLACLEQVKSIKSGKLILVLQLTIAVLTVGIIFTQSRGGLLVLGVGLAVFTATNVRQATPLALAILLYALLGFAHQLLGPFSWQQQDMSNVGESLANLQRYNLVSDLALTGGSGRTGIWKTLLEQTLSSPMHAAVGSGLGNIRIFENDHLINSAHSFFVSMTFWFGALGVAAFTLFAMTLGKAALRSHNTLSLYYIFMLGVSFFIDGYLLDANIIILNGGFLAIALAETKQAAAGAELN